MTSFSTSFRYFDRPSKARYVWEKYQSILHGRVLDVGADECHLKTYLTDPSQYWGIGLGGTPDQQVDLEQEGIPFEDNSFDCALCLDVMEHVNNPQHIFDELCRVSQQYVIIALPNPVGTFLSTLFARQAGQVQALKFYGLPPVPPEDRHKWFFSVAEAENFIIKRAAINNMRLLELSHFDPQTATGWRKVRRLMMTWLLRLAFNLSITDLTTGTIWAVLTHQQITS